MFYQNVSKSVQCLFLLTITTLGLVSCASHINRDAGKFSAVSVTNPSFMPQKGDKFAWYMNVFVDDAKSEIKVNEQAKNEIMNLVSKTITDAGYQTISNILGADYLVSAMVILGDETIDKIAPIFKAYPQIADSINNYEKGTLLIAIGRHSGETNSLMWEGAIQAYILGEELTEEQRLIRLERMVKRLMKALPQNAE